MTQILIHRSRQGIVLATDSRAVAFSGERDDPSGHFTVRKVFHPLPDVILAAGGAGRAQWLCEAFEQYIVENGLNDVSDAAEAALPLMLPLVEAIKKKHCPSIDHPHLDRFYIVVAGIHRPAGNPPTVAVHLFVSDHASDPLHEVETREIVAIPRQLILEHRLARMAEEEATLDAVEGLFEKFLSRTAEADEDIGPPFHFVRIQPTRIVCRISQGVPTAEAG